MTDIRYFHVGYTTKIKSVFTHNVKRQIHISKKTQIIIKIQSELSPVCNGDNIGYVTLDLT